MLDIDLFDQAVSDVDVAALSSEVDLSRRTRLHLAPPPCRSIENVRKLCLIASPNAFRGIEPGMGTYRLQLIGPFCLYRPDDSRFEISSKKSAALIAMLAMARGGERTRGWLQDRLWGSREQHQAQGSLRNELVNLRAVLNIGPEALIVTEGDRVRFNLNAVIVDAHQRGGANVGPGDSDHLLPGEFLEGLDIPGEEGFEEWLREQRGAVRERMASRDKRLAAIAPHDPTVEVVAPDLSSTRLRIDTFDGRGDRPSLAILPFANLTGSADNAYLSDGLSEELIDAVARLRWIPVIAASSSFSYRDPRTDRSVIARTLGVRYLLEGRLSGLEGEFSLSVAVSDLPSGRLVWSRRLSMPSILSHTTTDTLVRDIVGALDTGMDLVEQDRVRDKRAEDLNVNELVWRARWHMNRFTREDAALAKDCIAKAMTLQPNAPDVLIQATYSLAWSIWSLRRPMGQIKEMRKLAQRAIASDPLDGRSYMLAGMAETWLRHPVQAQLLLNQAISLNPSLSHAYAMLGSSLYLDNDPSAAIAPLMTAMRLSPHDEQMFRMLAELAAAHCMMENWDTAIEYADQSLVRRPAYWFAHAMRIAALVGKGDLPAARRANIELYENKPGFTTANIDWLPFVDPARTQFIREALEQSI